MKIHCVKCGQHLEGDDRLAGQIIKCPACGMDFEALPAAGPRQVQTFEGQTMEKVVSPYEAIVAQEFGWRIFMNSLRDSKEITAFRWLVACSIVSWLAIAAAIVAAIVESYGNVLARQRHFPLAPGSELV